MTSAPTRRPASNRGSSPPARSGRRLPLLPLIAGAIILIAVIAFLASGGDEASEGTSPTAPVTVSGTPLPPFSAGAPDPAIGMPAPDIVGTDFRGSAMDLSPGEHPTVLLFAAHWCQYCQAEIDALSPWLTEGGAGDVRFMTVSTAVDAGRPNYPPAAWFEREEWPGAVLADSPDSAAATAYGLTGYPFFVFLDGEGTVVARRSGALGPEALEELLAELVTAPEP